MDKRRQNGKLIERLRELNLVNLTPLFYFGHTFFVLKKLFMAARFLLQTFFLHIIPLLSFGLIEKLEVEKRRKGFQLASR